MPGKRVWALPRCLPRISPSRATRAARARHAGAWPASAESVCAEHLVQMSDLVLRGPLLTVAQVADQLSVSEKTVRRLVAREELPAVRVGHAIRVDRAQLTTGFSTMCLHPPPLTRAARSDRRKSRAACALGGR